MNGIYHQLLEECYIPSVDSELEELQTTGSALTSDERINWAKNIHEYYKVFKESNSCIAQDFGHVLPGEFSKRLVSPVFPDKDGNSRADIYYITISGHQCVITGKLRGTGLNLYFPKDSSFEILTYLSLAY